MALKERTFEFGQQLSWTGLTWAEQFDTAWAIAVACERLGAGGTAYDAGGPAAGSVTIEGIGTISAGLARALLAVATNARSVTSMPRDVQLAIAGLVREHA